MVMRTTSKSYSVAAFAFVVVLAIYIVLVFSFSNLRLVHSLSFSQGVLQRTWESRKIEHASQKSSATITCDRFHADYDLCSINGYCILDTRTGTFTLIKPSFAISPHLVEKIRPHPRKTDTLIMPKIKELTLISGPLGLTRSCDITHDSPAIVFSTGGYTGNIYHDFNDVLIPLFITASSVFPNRDFVLVVANPKEWWMSKYIHLLRVFSKHKTILLNQENVSTTHCFNSSVVGLISHGAMTIDPTRIPTSKSLVDFHNLLDKAFNTNHVSTLKSNKPRLVLVIRDDNIGRVMLNEKEIKYMLEDVGFEVIIFRPSKTTNLKQVYTIFKSSHGMVGVHGAALTHLLFLRPGSVFVQVVPVGLDWAAETCYGSPAKAMKLEYIEYQVNVGESSLVDKYNKDDLVLKDPIAFKGRGWDMTQMKIYLKEQDVRLYVNRFREHMNKAYKIAKSFMEING